MCWGHRGRFWGTCLGCFWGYVGKMLDSVQGICLEGKSAVNHQNSNIYLCNAIFFVGRVVLKPITNYEGSCTVEGTNTENDMLLTITRHHGGGGIGDGEALGNGTNKPH